MSDYKCRHLDFCDDGCQQRVAELEGELARLEETQPDKFSLAALRRLVDVVELVFDNDWDMTRYEISSGHSIHQNGSFLHPGVADESDNWWNRGAFLSEFRRALRLADATRAKEPTDAPT